MKAAKKHGTIISYDLNYRESLWKGIGGETRAREVNLGNLAQYVDVDARQRGGLHGLRSASRSRAFSTRASRRST